MPPTEASLQYSIVATPVKQWNFISMRPLSRFIATTWTLICFAGALCVPTSDAAAATCISNASQEQGCATVNVGGQTITYPLATWTNVGSYQEGDTPGFTSLLEAGAQSKVSLNAAAAQTGLSSAQIAQVVSTLPSKATIVFGRLSPLSGLMDVTAIRLIKQGTTVTLSTSKFNPYMGNRWAASRTYMSPSEKLSSAGPGPNPFQEYEGGDDEFHGVPQDGIAQAETILGVAARYYNAPIAYLNVAQFSLQQWVTTSHHLFTTTTTEHTSGSEKPLWYVGLPPGMAAASGNAGSAICLDGVSPCPVAEHIVPSGLVWSDWSNGGNLPNGTKVIHEFDVSHTGLNIIVIAAIIAVVSFGAFTALAAAAAAGTAAAGTSAAGLMVNLANAALYAVGADTVTAGATLGAAIDGLSYVAAAAAVQGAGPFSADNLVLSAPPTNTSQFQPQTSDESYFQSIEGQAMTAPVGQIENQVDTSGNNGFQAFSTFDQGYNTNAQPSPNTNLQFNSMQYIQDTQ
jgi:hypothetical protein